MKNKREFSAKSIDIENISQDEQIEKHFKDEQEKMRFEKEKHKYITMVDELKKRLNEIYEILMSVQSISLMTLYLICLHHELYVKSNVDVETIKEILSDAKKGHDIKFLLSKSTEIKGERKKVIEDDCKTVIEIAPRLGGVKNYPYLRYNFSKSCLDNQNDYNIILCDLVQNDGIIEKMRKNTLERFYGRVSI